MRLLRTRIILAVGIAGAIGVIGWPASRALAVERSARAREGGSARAGRISEASASGLIGNRLDWRIDPESDGLTLKYRISTPRYARVAKAEEREKAKLLERTAMIY